MSSGRGDSTHTKVTQSADKTPLVPWHADDVSDGFAPENRKSRLRIVICGSPADGKSTLIGRLREASEAAAEREQAIAVDVAHHRFSTERRQFIVADPPGHDENITRNIVTAATGADCALILVDAHTGILTVTRHHSRLVSLLGIREIALVVNKMDAIGYSEARFHEIEGEYRALAAGIGLERVTCIPVSALTGDNVVSRSDALPSYRGPTLMDYLETVEVDELHEQLRPFRMPVQQVNRPGQAFTGYTGTVVGGSVQPRDRVVVAPSGRTTHVARIVTDVGDLDQAMVGQSVTLALADELDVAPGDVIAAASAPPGVADQFEATIIWIGDEPMLPGRAYLMKLGAQSATATVAPLKYKLNVDSPEHVAATKLERDEIGVCELELTEPMAFDPYAENREMGGFILIDRISDVTMGAGLLHFALRRSHNVRWQAVAVDKRARAIGLHQQPTVVWLTGLSGAGKSTIANLVEGELQRRGHHTYLLDGDNVRHGLNADLGFTDADRVENIRRVGEVAHLMADAGLIVLVSFISPFRAERRMARSLFHPGEFLEVFVDAPLAVAEQRDPKGLYRKARRGELINFTGIDSPYEPPERPEVHLDTTALTPAQAAARVIEVLEERERLSPP